MVRKLPWVLGALLAATVADWTAFKLGWLPLRPALFAGLVALLMALLALESALLLGGLASRRLPALRGFAGLAIVGGLLTACAGGMANWLLSLQCAAILTEGEAITLSAGSPTLELESGPLADSDELDFELSLTKVELLPGRDGTFTPVSLLGVAHEAGPEQALRVSPGNVGRVGAIRLHQGAFGFAPRIVILKGDQAVFDRVVPFTTGRQGARGVSFHGEFTLEKEGLAIAGDVSLDSLDERMRGHATLGLEVKKEGRVLGSGALLPGHFADLEEGYRIGFAGLKKWSEIDVSRKNYPLPIFVGLGMMVLGGLVWPIAVWRRW